MWRVLNFAITLVFVLALGPSLKWVFWSAIALAIASLKLMAAIGALVAYVVLWWLFTRAKSAIRRSQRD